MACHHCGANVPPSAGQCPACRRDLASSSVVAAALLTPVPGTGSGIDLEITRLVSPPRDRRTRDRRASDRRTNGSSPHGDAEETRLPGLPTPRSSTPPARAESEDAGSDTGSRPRTGPLVTGQEFGRYHIIKVLGIGGMGAVYQAWDAELGMAVAVKVIRPEVTSEPAAAQEMERRFKQELVLARQVTHKNVVRIHDLGDIGGIKYITMPYLEGSDLATVLRETGTLPVPVALRIVRDVAAGLVAAHDAGIVHRDLKPANIMVLAEHAVIMDFGIARLSTRVPGGAAHAANPGESLSSMERLTTEDTVTGVTLGTVQYMAPEQATGRSVDQRADIYALGLIFRDMLLGKRTASGADQSAVTELKGRIAQAPPLARTIDPNVPEAVEQVIGRCVEPDPVARFQTSADLVAALSRLDEHGVPIPVRRVVGLPLLVGVATVLAMVAAGSWWYAGQLQPPPAHDPVSVVIADFQNTTSDPALDRSIEPILKLALEEAGFISAHDRTQIARNLGVQPPAVLDEAAARAIAVQQGLGVVISGSVARRGSSFVLSIKAIEAVTGNVIATDQDSVSNREQVLGAAAQLAATVREALGDETSDSAQRFAQETLSTTSLDVVRRYAAAIEANAAGRFDDARQNFSAAVALDPDFGLAYAGMAMMSRNLGQQQDAERYAKEAVRHLDRMTERERYRTRGLSFMVTGDSQSCVKEYGDLIARYAADAAAHNNLALCYTYLRNMRAAIGGMQRVVAILPKRALYRVNLGLYAAYGGDFPTAQREAQVAQDLGSPLGLLPLAFSQLGLGQLSQAAGTYRQLAAVGAAGASYAASGLADLALYEGRLADAERAFAEGAAADLASKDADRAASKLAGIAAARLARGRHAAAVAAAKESLVNGQSDKIRFLAARTFVQGGDVAAARTLSAGLAAQFQAEPRAYAKIVDAEIAMQAGDPREAVRLLTEANTLLDTWIGRFDLGRAYLEAGAFTQADAEFDRCLTRRGEALSLFLDEEPTYGYLPPVYYYQGRVREGLGSAGATESYRTFLAIRERGGDDPLIADARRRLGR